MARQDGIHDAARLVPHVALQAEADLDATRVHMQLRTRAHRPEIPEREKRHAVHPVRPQIDDAPVRAVLIEDRLGPDVGLRRLSAETHVPYFTTKGKRVRTGHANVFFSASGGGLEDRTEFGERIGFAEEVVVRMVRKQFRDHLFART